jgi:hypothetical protein
VIVVPLAVLSRYAPNLYLPSNAVNRHRRSTHPHLILAPPSAQVAQSRFEIIFIFGALQLRLHRFEIMYLEVVASKVGYLNIL